MPTENEFKFVLEPQQTTIDEISILATKTQEITQGYLCFSRGSSTRIRCVTQKHKDKKKWFFTFKQKVRLRVIELEHRIDERDALELWENCVGKVKKVRYIIPHEGEKWEVDFFFDGAGLCYFAMAEIERPEGESAPKILPEFVQKHLLHIVSPDDDRFANKRLGDIDYASVLYESLKYQTL